MSRELGFNGSLRLVLTLVLILVVTAFADGKAPTAVKLKQVLVLHTLKSNRPWVIQFDSELLDALKEECKVPYYVDIECLGTHDQNADGYFEVIDKAIKYRYGTAEKPDVIVATFSGAINYARNKPEFKDIPKIEILNTAIMPEQNCSKTIVTLDNFAENIKHALKLFPDTKTVYVIAGSSQNDHEHLDMFKQQVKELESKVKFEYSVDSSVADIDKQVSALPGDSIVYYLSYTTDEKGKGVMALEVANVLAQKSSRPVFTFAEMLARTGIFGGRTNSFNYMADSAATIISELFAGKKIEDIVVPEQQSKFIYNAEQLTRFNISEDKLPAEKVILSK